MELTDTMLVPTNGFICASCGSTNIIVRVGEGDGRLLVVICCSDCDNELEFQNGNRSN